MLEIPSGMSAHMAIVEKGQKISLESLQLHVSPMIIVIFQMPIRDRFLFYVSKTVVKRHYVSALSVRLSVHSHSALDVALTF